MSAVTSFEELYIWQVSREFCKNIFGITNHEQFLKDFKLKDQIRASSGSIMDNIAEGFERNGNKEFVQFLYIAKGSCGETRSQLYRALDSKYIIDEEFNVLKQKAIHLSQSIENFIKYLKQSELTGSKYKK
jgi:four helix bundle protein